jgi:hypothetical protein
MSENEVYRKKPNGRYECIGHEWTGFPANGIWLVKDGSHNCLIQLKDLCEKPKKYLELAEFQDECANYIREKADRNGGYSIYEVSQWAAEFYSEVLGHEHKFNSAEI